MSTKLRLSLVVSLILLLMPVVPVPVVAISADPANPEPLSGDMPGSGTLAGSQGGAFAFYSLSYPGDESVAILELDFSPSDPVTSRAVGFNVYGPNGFLIGSGTVVEAGLRGISKLEYSDGNPATWLVQVYNYAPESEISYSLTVEGLPEPPAPAPEATPMPVSETVQAAEAGTTVSGSLLGDHGGAYATYEFSSQGQESDMTVSVVFTPDTPATRNSVGFVVYGPSGKLADGQASSLPGQRDATFLPDVAGTYRILVYNYVDGFTVNYTLTR